MADVKKKLNDASIIEIAVEPSDTDLIMVVVGGDARKMTYATFKSAVLTAGNVSGLGTIATQDADSVAITGGDITGITDLAVADGGTGASTASGARTNLGIAIGSDVQAYDADLSAIAAIAPTKGRILAGDGASWNVLDVGADGEAIIADSGEVTGLTFGSSGSSLTVDTRANILATASPSSGDMFYATDTQEFFVYDGTNFQVSSLEFQAKSTFPDIGLQPPLVVNDLAGYSAEYITDKLIANSRIGSNVNTDEGSIRVSSGTLQIYLNSAWNDVVTGFRLREDSNGSYELEHKPIGFDRWYEILSGNSDMLGLNGLPITRQYSTDIGAYPTHLQVVGRNFE